MKTTRLEAFSDGVLAIIITIRVLELKVPHAVELAALKPVLSVLLSRVPSFIYLGIYWNNHHHLFQATKQVRGGKEVTLTPGQTFYEGPEDVHVVGRNASQAKPAKFVVFWVKDKGAPVLVRTK